MRNASHKVSTVPDGTQLRRRGRPYPPTALQSANPEDILARYLNDERTEDIAASYGVTRKALNHFLLTKAEDVWRAAQVTKFSAAKDAADDYLTSLQARIDAFKGIQDKDQRQSEIEACRLQLPLARERARRAEWELERLLSRLYGQKQEVEHRGQVTVEIVRFAPQQPINSTAFSIEDAQVIDK